ncbi:MAG: PucR family transcriptional regulator, partial [Candidatus Dormibacteria bacterium]
MDAQAVGPRPGRRDRRGYSALPSVSPVIIQSLGRRVDRVARRMAIEIGRTIPVEEGVGGASAFGSEVLAACREGVGTLLSLWGESRPPSAVELQHLSRMGGRLASTGMPLDAILRAYRVAALVIWQHVVDVVRIHPEIDPESVLTAVAPLFDYLDSISVAVSNSYLESRERARREQDRQYDQFFSEVLGGTADAEMVARAAEGGTVLEFPYRLVVVGADDTLAEATIATAWLVVGAHVALYQSHVVALVPANVKVGSLERLLRVATGSSQAPWPLALGPVASNLGQVPTAARAARDALTVGEVLEPGVAVHDAASLHPYLAWLHDLSGLADFVESSIGALLQRERTRKLPLRATLEAVLSHDGPSATARALGVHRHTLLYRTERIRDLVGDWDRAEDRLRLELALRASRLLDALAPEHR